MAKLNKFNSFIDDIQFISILDNEKEKEFNKSLRLLLEISTTEIILLRPKQVNQIYKRINDIQTKFRIFWNEYNDLSKLEIENVISVFRFKQLLGYSFNTDESTKTIDKETAKKIIMKIHWNSSLLAKLKNRIIDHFPEVIQDQTAPPEWMKKFPLLKDIWEREQLRVIAETNTNEPKPIKIPELKDNSEQKEKAENILIVLTGRWINDEKIMTGEQYKEIIEGVFYLMDNGKVKTINKPIIQKASMQFIRKLFRKLNSDLYGKRIKNNFIEFLHAYFECFKNSTIETTKEHFNEYTNGDFSAHYNKVLQSIEK